MFCFVSLRWCACGGGRCDPGVIGDPVPVLGGNRFASFNCLCAGASSMSNPPPATVLLSAATAPAALPTEVGGGHVM